MQAASATLPLSWSRAWLSTAMSPSFPTPLADLQVRHLRGRGPPPRCGVIVSRRCFLFVNFAAAASQGTVPPPCVQEGDSRSALVFDGNSYLSLPVNE